MVVTRSFCCARMDPRNKDIVSPDLSLGSAVSRMTEGEVAKLVDDGATQSTNFFQSQMSKLKWEQNVGRKYCAGCIMLDLFHTIY